MFISFIFYGYSVLGSVPIFSRVIFQTVARNHLGERCDYRFPVGVTSCSAKGKLMVGIDNAIKIFFFF